MPFWMWPFRLVQCRWCLLRWADDFDVQCLSTMFRSAHNHAVAPTSCFVSEGLALQRNFRVTAAFWMTAATSCCHTSRAGLQRPCKGSNLRSHAVYRLMNQQIHHALPKETQEQTGSTFFGNAPRLPFLSTILMVYVCRLPTAHSNAFPSFLPSHLAW